MKIGNWLDRISSLKSKNNSVPIIIVVMVVSVLVDSQIGIIADFIPEYLSSPTGLTLFVSLTLFSILSSFFLIYYVKRIEDLTVAKYIYFKLIYYVVLAAQSLIALMLIFTVLQILILQEYDSLSLFVIHIISYSIWIGVLGLLARAFVLWYKNFNRNSMILIFALAMIAYVLNGVFGLIYTLDTLTQQNSIISLGDVAYFPEFSIESIGSQIDLIYTGCSVVAFILTWIGSVKLLYRYIRRIGKFKFWTIMIISLIYYNIEFPLFALGYFDPVDDANALLNILIFSFGGILAGIIFGISFLSIAKTLKINSVVRNQLILTAYGFLLFYITGSAVAAQVAYPPFGLISVSLIGLSCYLIYSGLYSSAQIVSQDTVLLKSIKNSITEQANFLGGIGTAHRNKELESRVLTIAKDLENEIEQTSGVQSSLDETEIVDYIQYVVNEIHKNKK